MGYKFGGRQAGSKNKKTVERENLLSRAIGELDRPLGKDVLAEVMMTLRGMAHDLAEAARAGDKEAQQKRVYYQGTLETDKGELSGSSATGGATVSGARRKDARPSALSFSALRSPAGCTARARLRALRRSGYLLWRLTPLRA